MVFTVSIGVYFDKYICVLEIWRNPNLVVVSFEP